MKIRAIAAVLIGFAVSGPAQAFTGQCVLVFDGKGYLNGPCPIRLEKGGDFAAGADNSRALKHFATVSIDKAAGNGGRDQRAAATRTIRSGR